MARLEFNSDGSLKVQEAMEVSELNLKRSRKIANKILEDYNEKKGVFKEFQFPPEYILPEGMKRGSEDQLIYITLTAALDFIRDATQLWKQSHDAKTSEEYGWIFNTKEVVSRGQESIIQALTEIKDRRPKKDGGIWFTICKKLIDDFDGRVYELLKSLDLDAVKISHYLSENAIDFPYLAGRKIRLFWLRMVNDTAGINLRNMEELSLPIDVHTARMSLKILFKEEFDGKTYKVMNRIQKAWKKVLKGTNHYSIQLDEPLWLMGKYKFLDKFLKENDLS